MTDFNDTLGFDRGSASSNYRGVHKTYVSEVLLDFVAITAARVAAGATALGDADKIQVMDIPAHTLVLAVGVEVLVVEGGTCTMDIGSADPDGFIDGANANTLTHGTPHVSTDSATGYATGFYYGTADTLDLTMVNAMDTCVLRIWAVCVDCNGSVEYVA